MHVNYRRETRFHASKRQRPNWNDSWTVDLKKHGARRIRALERDALNRVLAGDDPDEVYWPHDKKDRGNPWDWD